MVEYHMKPALMDKTFAIIDKMNFPAFEYCPTIEELKLIVQNPEKYAPFLMWIDETGYDTEENQEARAIIRAYLNNYVLN